MILVYIPGVWDLLHVGHVTILERARALGDRLIVGVPSDEVVELDKGQPPVIPLQERMRMLSALRCVDMAVAYYELEFNTHLEMFRPDILAVGSTWGVEVRHAAAQLWVQSNGKRLVTLPYSPDVSTSNIKERVRCR